jgi:hypothetical protein
MEENLELRIPEDRVHLLFGPDEGKSLGSTRVIKVPTSDPRIEEIGALERRLSSTEDRCFFFGWRYHRRYTAEELKGAELFYLQITAVFEPEGESCGTVYDESTACPECGAGAKQVSDLMLDLRKVPKTKDLAKSTADECIVSQRLAELLIDAKMTGFDLRPVRHKARYQDDAVDYRKYPTGRELLRRGNVPPGELPSSGAFWVWLNRSEQRALVKRVLQEHAATREKREKRGAVKPLPVWYQLVVTSPPVPAIPPTRFGIDPFDDDLDGEYRCRLGHVSGLNLLSEVWVPRAAWDGSDIVQTENMVGVRRGVLRPTPLLLISPRLWRLLEAHHIKKYKVEVAHLINSA